MRRAVKLNEYEAWAEIAEHIANGRCLPGTAWYSPRGLCKVVDDLYSWGVIGTATYYRMEDRIYCERVRLNKSAPFLWPPSATAPRLEFCRRMARAAAKEMEK